MNLYLYLIVWLEIGLAYTCARDFKLGTHLERVNWNIFLGGGGGLNLNFELELKVKSYLHWGLFMPGWWLLIFTHFKVRHAKNTSLSYPKNSEIFRLKRASRNLTTATYATNLKAYLSKLSFHVNMGPQDFQAALDKLTTPTVAWTCWRSSFTAAWYY